MRAFVDTSALLALSHSRDQNHRQAASIVRRRKARGDRYVGSVLILSEFHAHLMYLRGPEAASAALNVLLEDPEHEWVEVTPDLVREARSAWIRRFVDQPFSLTDAVSFEIMRRERVRHAFAFDRHFQVAGFELLDG
jgi:predicted nucleic acid-binding protein